MHKRAVWNAICINQHYERVLFTPLDILSGCDG